MSKKYYTIQEVNNLLPSLEKTFCRILQMHVQVQNVCRRLDFYGFLPENEEIDLCPPDAGQEVVDDLASLKVLIVQLNAELEKLSDMGCLVKSLDKALVDWYAKFDGRDVLLCWKLGEKSVSYWHEEGDTYEDRRLITELVEVN